MKDLEFIEGSAPSGFKPEAEQFIFTLPEHRALQSPKNWISFHLVHTAKKKIYASLHFHVDGTLAESPYKAPFGGIDFAPHLQPEQLYEFIHTADARMRSKGIKRVVLRNPPQAYNGNRAVIASVVLMNAGYTVLRAEINTSLPVTNVLFEKGIDSWELRKLKQARKAKLKCIQVNIGHLEEVYSFIAACRTERGQALSMTFAELQTTATAFPKAFQLFGVYQHDELMAASVAIRVSKRILYNFYSAHPRRFDQFSPVVILTEGLYDWCHQHQAELLDLGTSALGDVPNFSLLDFKLRLGGIPSARLTYGKNL